MRGSPLDANDPPGEMLASRTIPCTDGLQEARLSGLALGNRFAYAVSVRAFDRVGNEVAGCGQEGESRGRQTNDETWQRAVIIDSTINTNVAVGPVRPRGAGAARSGQSRPDQLDAQIA